MAPADAQAAEAARVKGNEAFKAEKYEEAALCFSEAIRLDPNDAVFYSNRSACYSSLSKFDAALEDATICVEMKPEWYKGYARKGLAEFYLQRFEDAEATYKKGLALAPDDQAMKDGLQRVREIKTASEKKALASSPEALRVALELLKQKKKEAAEKEDYETAGKLKKKLDELEAALAKLGPNSTGGAGGGGGDVTSELAKLKERLAKQAAENPSGAPQEFNLWRSLKRACCPDRYFESANPFSTWRRLRGAGYSGVQTCGVLALIYIVSLASPLLFLAAGSRLWRIAGPPGGEGQEEEHVGHHLEN